MRTRYTTYDCDQCGTSETTTGEVLPDGWWLLLVGTDQRGPNKWSLNIHLCDNCHTGLRTYLVAARKFTKDPHAEPSSELTKENQA